MQAIIWLNKPLKTVFFDVEVLVCDVDEFTDTVTFPDGQKLDTKDSMVMSADDISDTANFLLKNSEGGWIAGVVDSRANQ